MLVAIFFIPLWLGTELAGAIVSEYLFTEAFVAKPGRKVPLALMALVFGGLLFLSWLTVQQLKS